jgi:hypothetical protein
MLSSEVLLDDIASPNARKAEIQWSEQREYVLVSIIKHRNAFMKTKGAKMEDKKMIAFNDLRSHPSFADVRDVITVNAMMQKFMRLKTAVRSKYSLDREGANLSGLPENPPRVEALVYKMLEQEMQTKVSVSAKKKKEDERAERMKVLQEQELARQVRVQPSTSNSDGNESEDPASSLSASQGSVSSKDGKGKKKTSAMYSPAEDNWLQLLNKKEKRRAEQAEEEVSTKKLLMELEEKRFALEERRLLMEEQRIAVDRQRVANEQMMFENQRKMLEMAFKEK